MLVCGGLIHGSSFRPPEGALPAPSTVKDVDLQHIHFKYPSRQRQRMALAKAILWKAKILLLDEATSALDTASEYQVQQALRSAMGGRTTIAVAQRLKTIMHADEILVLDKG
ncbi:uncharacterized protein BP01DRAFT_379726 [Aspergillus saccharolyticus JOP 1030-1]|uniref:P-loop containing nucleoside triphosphate hydrolase protein n=1 Tax=Aspergillus saccharolyticus JOP 1030-1 TaxID=1450539 RepID=A0A319AQ58_9EURO|nr:hypothetical protein BP01DRAFT_379726 [Aspergillus saccharolyticus JOP 1030-1]PYH48542.1 hypothetical protein BP01DRAFT_379726 [Aspergillus saccharolyticus JOP 1030-1]